MGKKFLAILTILFTLIIAYLLVTLNKVSNNEQQNTSGAKIVDGVQYIDLTAKGGYSPRVVTAKADQKTILRVRTSNTFDCSSAIVIPALNYRETLPATGVTEINIPPQNQNTVMQGTCSMGMYRFSIKFI